MKVFNIVLMTIFCSLLIVPSCQNNKKTNQNKTVATIGDNSRNSLEWNGVYSGVLPCVDCEGVQTTITLNKDYTYEMREIYLGLDHQEYVLTGTFTWDDNGSKIKLNNTNSQEPPVQYLVGENRLIPLDWEGNRINSEYNYELIKISGIVEKYWKLTEIDGEKVILSENSVREAHIILKIENSRIIGNSGCNSFHGTYTIRSGNSIAFSKMASTMMACLDVNIEHKVFQAIENTRFYSVEGDKLELKDENNKILARFEAVYM